LQATHFLSTIDILEKEIVDEIEFIIYPEPEKFYIDIPELRIFLENWDFLKDKNFEKIERVFIVDNSKFKNFIKKNGEKYYIFYKLSKEKEEDIKKEFIQKDKPHYLLVVEMKKRNEFHYLVLDSTRRIYNQFTLRKALMEPAWITSARLSNLYKLIGEGGRR
jgi:hypothetical protein